VSAYERIAGLPLRIEGYSLEILALELRPEFRRLTTVIRLHGGGEEGVGEDVCYDEIEHTSQAEGGPVLPLAGEFDLDGFSRHLDGLDIFHAGAPVRPMYDDYRRWAYESAALDLALRQAGTSLADALGRTPQPVRFVVSTRLDDPPTPARVLDRLAREPSLRFKLDPTDDWSDELMAELAALGAIDILDMKGQYAYVPFGVPEDPETYARALARFPDAWIEDPRTSPDIRAVLAGHEHRITWDAPIHSAADIRALDWAPRMINVKPSRFGPLSRLFEAYDHLAAQGIGAYGGGQTELGPGRGQIQYLASLFHPDAPNDTAPSGYNEPVAPPDLPASPLPVAASRIGFRWGSEDGGSR
jgi:L-alanine-DL-glutamate epimerase-like enolase superfamily enzyme